MTSPFGNLQVQNNHVFHAASIQYSVLQLQPIVNSFFSLLFCVCYLRHTVQARSPVNSLQFASQPDTGVCSGGKRGGRSPGTQIL